MWTLRPPQRASTRHRNGASIALLQLLALALALGLACLPWVYAARAASVRAHAARTLNVTDVAHLHLVGTSGELLEEEGPATGALPGKVKARFDVSTSITGSFVFYPNGGGSITGNGSARLHSTGTYSSFGGTLAVSHGTGRYVHAHGSGGLYGTVNRHTDALVIQTTGKLSY
jgi:hypothetical protein